MFLPCIYYCIKPAVRSICTLVDKDSLDIIRKPLSRAGPSKKEGHREKRKNSVEGLMPSEGEQSSFLCRSSKLILF